MDISSKRRTMYIERLLTANETVSCKENRKKRKYVMQQRKLSRTDADKNRSPLSNITNAQPPIFSTTNAVNSQPNIKPLVDAKVVNQSKHKKGSTKGGWHHENIHTKRNEQPEIDQNTDGVTESVDDVEIDSEVKKFLGISKEYIDHGDATFVCTLCKAFLWKDEMRRGNKYGKKTAFSHCCSNGDIELPTPPPPPSLLKNLYKSNSSQSQNFINNIKAYNMMFSFTSLGGKIDKSVARGRGPYVFRLQGQNFHRIGSLLPDDGSQPKFSQLYIYDSENEISNRQKAVSSDANVQSTSNNQLDPQTIKDLKDIL
ncbi:hypothetical protein QVD17_15499 [Tagetes erecta]|uniref:Uncharacterized protein n=1 Tax=Tagetes erecta TaxID=13708 RepID=A0AAD8KQ82_TARER|nr:hypothetical protein QVD17_15499 [Tagetes erecta]